MESQNRGTLHQIGLDNRQFRESSKKKGESRNAGENANLARPSKLSLFVR